LCGILLILIKASASRIPKVRKDSYGVRGRYSGGARGMRSRVAVRANRKGSA
jgi:hypothetical protein